ncbi:hypothetical protein Tco_0815941, partial [Tanacetum coccineum]
TMADVNVNAPAEQALAMAPPTHTDEHILPRSRWAPFWDTVRYDKTTGSYSSQLDEQWFDLTKDTLSDAFQITPVDNNNAFSSPPTPDVLIKFVNDLGYPKVVRTLSDAGVVKRAHIDYAERMWEEFTQSIHTFIEDKKNLAQHTQGKKKSTLIVIPSVRFTKLIIHHLQSKHKFHPRPGSPLHLPNEESVLGYLKFSAKGTKREVFGMPILNNLITADIQGEQYYNAYLEKVAKHQRYLAGEEVSNPDSPAPKPAKATKPKATKPSKPLAPKAAPITKPAAAKAPKTTASRPPKPTPETTEPSKKDQSKKRKLVKESSEAPSPAKRPKAGKVIKKQTQKSSLRLVDEFADEGVPVNEPRFSDEEAHLQKAVEESLKDVHAAHQGPLLPVVIREPKSGKFQPLPETPKKKSPADQYVFQRRSSAPTEPSGHDESSSLYAELDEGHAGPNPGIQDEGQVGSNPGDAAVSQPQPSHVVHAGPNLKHMDVEVTDTSIQQNPEQMDKEFITMTYPNVQENLKLPTEDQVRLEEPASSAGTLSSLQNLDKEFSFTNQFLEEKSQEEKPEKTNTESEVQSMVMVPIHQNTSYVPLMTTPVIDLTVSQPVSTTVQAPLQTSTATRIGELEQHMADLVQDNLALEEILDKHGSRLDRFRDLPEADMKEILHQRIWEIKSYEAHEDHKNLKKKRRHESPKPPPGSPHHQSPPYPLPVGPSGTLGASSTSGFSSKTDPSAEYTAWTTIDTRLSSSVSSTPDDLNMDDDLVLDAQWKPLSEEDRPAIPEPAWSIPSSDLPTGDMATFMDWYYKKKGITELTQKDLEGIAFEIVKVFHPDVIHLQYQIEECHKLLTDQVNDAILRYNVSKPLPLGGPQGQVTIQSDFFFNKDLEYLRYGSKGSRPTLSISKMKVAYYPDVGLEQMVPDQLWIDEECKYDIAAMYGISHWWFQRQRFYIDRHTSEGDRRAARTHMRILSVVRIEVFSLYGYDYMKKIVLRYLNHLPPTDKKILTTAVNLWTRNLVIRQRVEDFQLGIESYQTQLNLTKPRLDATGPSSSTTLLDDTLQQINEALDYRVKEFKVNRMNPGLDTRFWTRKDVKRRKEFMFTIQKRLKIRRIFRNLESFDGGRTYNIASSTLMLAIMIQKCMSMPVRRSQHHMEATLPQGWFGDLLWPMISKNAHRSYKSKKLSSEITTLRKTVMMRVEEEEEELEEVQRRMERERGLGKVEQVTGQFGLQDSKRGY